MTGDMSLFIDRRPENVASSRPATWRSLLVGWERGGGRSGSCRGGGVEWGYLDTTNTGLSGCRHADSSPLPTDPHTADAHAASASAGTTNAWFYSQRAIRQAPTCNHPTEPTRSLTPPFAHAQVRETCLWTCHQGGDFVLAHGEKC